MSKSSFFVKVEFSRNAVYRTVQCFLIVSSPVSFDNGYIIDHPHRKNTSGQNLKHHFKRINWQDGGLYNDVMPIKIK